MNHPNTEVTAYRSEKFVTNPQGKIINRDDCDVCGILGMTLSDVRNYFTVDVLEFVPTPYEIAPRPNRPKGSAVNYMEVYKRKTSDGRTIGFAVSFA